MKQLSWWQFLLPHHWLSKTAGKLAECRWPSFKNWAIRAFSHRYGVDLSEAEIENHYDFATFNEFFTRKLKASCRPLPVDEQAIISPVDGSISQIGQLKQQQILQAKGKYYSLSSLLGGDRSLAELFADGSFLTAYLAPKDYHRIHMPVNGRLLKMILIPGKLFSVNEGSVAKINQLFARNERVIWLFDSPYGPFAVIAIGAMIVGSIVAAWHGVVNSTHPRQVMTWDYHQQMIQMQRGDELGYFQLGSTVVLLFPGQRMMWDNRLHAGSSLKMGETIGHTVI